MTRSLLTTYEGRPLPVDYEHDWERGCTTYRTKHGGFLLKPPDVRDHGIEIEVQYGIGHPSRYYGYEDRPEAPVFFGITLHGATVVRPDDMKDGWGEMWVSAHRLTGRLTTEPVPTATRRRVADVVYTLAHHWRDLPEHLTLRHAFEVWKAPGRLSELEHMIGIRVKQIQDDRDELNEWRRLAGIQASLAAEA